MRSFALTALLLAVVAAPAAAAPKVTTMVAGKSRVLAGPKTVTAKAGKVKVGKRRCAVGRATPLAALARLHLKLRLKDYGSCGRRAADSTGLFVTRIGPDRNRGQNGWVYKVGRKVPSTGAADTTAKRLRTGARVLWFFCRMQAGGGCQRTLEATPDAAVTAGQPLRVTVRGYDDNGRGRPVAGATVMLGDATAQTGADGVATLAAPAGPARLAATAAGMVPSFPRTVG